MSRCPQRSLFVLIISDETPRIHGFRPPGAEVTGINRPIRAHRTPGAGILQEVLYCAGRAAPLSCALRPAAAPSTPSPSASCAPSTPARRCNSALCSISDVTSMSTQATGRCCAGVSTTSSPVSSPCPPIALRRWNRTPSASPPTCSPTSVSAPLRRQRAGDVLDIAPPLGRRRAGGIVGDGAARASHAVRGVRDGRVDQCCGHRFHHRAHGPTGLRARGQALARRTQRPGRAAGGGGRHLRAMRLYRASPPSRSTT